MSEEFKNEFDESKETETDNVNMQEETETVSYTHLRAHET